jgi:hypothetical protein
VQKKEKRETEKNDKKEVDAKIERWSNKLGFKKTKR